MEFDIAYGKHRKDKSWKNRTVQWPDFVKRLSETHRTAETHAEYLAATKARQDEVKDVGGFVGGFLAGGKRRKTSVIHRQLITLDLDHATAEFWNDFTLTYDCAAVLYSTHKHSPEAARYRLIIPLSRPVFPDEYEAISRRIAGDMDIELFDPTTFQAERMMYWPSTSKDGEYVFMHQEGLWLDADEVLANYTDWKDTSSWPVSEKINAIVRRNMTKQGDPLEKPGLVGAFCRTYNIHEVIEKYLPDMYTPCDIEGRYTYTQGSTSGGLVTYNDKFAFSHHGTDPTGGKLCNAFDLVRIHKFGLQDEDANDGTRGNKLPSFLAMCDLVSSDPVVVKEMVEERLAGAKSDFDFADPLDETDDTEDERWKEKIETDRKGNIYATIDNISLILENDKYFKGKIAFDDFEKCEVALRDLPWRKVSWNTRRLTDRDDANIRHYLERVYGISNAVKTRDAMQILCEKTCFHPVKQYLNALSWDGIERLDTLLIDYQGAEDNEYTRTVTRKTLVAAVSRVFNPGVKFDTILTLIGEQGLKKSTLIAKLGRQWFSDSFSFTQLKNDTKACEQIQGVWIVEIPEMSGLYKADIEAVKHFVAKRNDKFRVVYGRRTETFQRQCVFFATTNDSEFLRDPTGNRRYWPVTVFAQKPKYDVYDLDDYAIGQIWAEAMVNFQDGETLFLTREMEKIAEKIQKKHTEEHPWVGVIHNYLDTLFPATWNRMNIYDKRAFLAGELDDFTPDGSVYKSRVCVAEIWAEALKMNTLIDERSAKIIRKIMSVTEGWEMIVELKKYGAYGPQRKGYFRTKDPVTEGEIEVTTEGNMLP